jgi:hypothetical protein
VIRLMHAAVCQALMVCWVCQRQVLALAVPAGRLSAALARHDAQTRLPPPRTRHQLGPWQPVIATQDSKKRSSSSSSNNNMSQ